MNTALVGLLVDVSASMVLRAFGKGTRRWAGVRQALDDLVGGGDRATDAVRIFAVGFGFGNPLFSSTGPSVRTLFDTTGLAALAREWPGHRRWSSWSPTDCRRVPSR